MDSTAGANSTTPRAAAIAAACTYMSRLHGAFAERFEAAHRLLVRGGWTCAGTTLRFPDGVIVEGDACSCQEGRGPVVCLHQLAARMLLIALRQGAPAATSDAAPDAPHCKDCGVVLGGATPAARCGNRTLTICTPCLRQRRHLGRRQQLARDARLVATIRART